MNYGSVCSGIEAATVAWHPLGWKPAWFSEIERFPNQVLAHHYPTVENRGDMTKFKEWPDGSIDLLVGGTPCQSFSVAGLRKGLADPRGNLALVFLGLVDRARPRWVVWENVPGVLLVDKGRAFGSFLGGLGQLGYGWAYRILDAQYFGVPQRRRRVFVVGRLGDWRPAAAVLFERACLRGDPAPSRRAGKGTFAAVAPSLVSSGRGVARSGDTRGQDPVVAVDDGVPDVAWCLQERAAKGADSDTKPGHLIPVVSPPLTAKYDAAHNGECQRGTLVIPIQEIGKREGIAKTPSPDAEGRLRLRNPGIGVGNEGDPSYTLQAGAQHGVAVPLAFSSKDHGADVGETAPTLKAGGHDSSHPNGGVPPAVVLFDEMQVTSKTNRSNPKPGDPCHTLHKGVPPTLAGMQVRRLTPRECERLQGFPDDYTLIKRGKKMSADGPRYKALGNSMAVPVMRWIGQRIQMVEAIT